MNKRNESRPNIADAIMSRESQLVINTPIDRRSQVVDALIRKNVATVCREVAGCWQVAGRGSRGREGERVRVRYAGGQIAGRSRSRKSLTQATFRRSLTLPLPLTRTACAGWPALARSFPTGSIASHGSPGRGRLLCVTPSVLSPLPSVFSTTQ